MPKYTIDKGPECWKLYLYVPKMWCYVLIRTGETKEELEAFFKENWRNYL